MKIIYHFLLSILFFMGASCSYDSSKEWHPAKLPNIELPDYVSRKVDHIKYTLHSSWGLIEREQIISDTQKWMDECRKIADEVSFKDSLHVFIARNREDMKFFCGSSSLAGLTSVEDPILNENCIFSIYVYNGKCQPLKHEMMHFITFTKWGYNNVPDWLSEGIATFAAPEYYSCDGLTLEERYAYLLQNEKLLDIKALMQFINLSKEPAFDKAAYNQSAYLVSYLVGEYGIDKLKELWKTGSELHKSTAGALYEEIERLNLDLNSEEVLAMKRKHYCDVYNPIFKKIYGENPDSIIERINSKITKKYPKPIKMDWEGFGKSCVD